MQTQSSRAADLCVLDIVSVCPLNQDVSFQVEHIQGSTGTRHGDAALTSPTGMLSSLTQAQNTASSGGEDFAHNLNTCFDYDVMHHSRPLLRGPPKDLLYTTAKAGSYRT